MGRVTMKPLFISGVSGLYQEFFLPDTVGIEASPVGIVNGHLDAAQIFWTELLCREKIEALIQSLLTNIHNPQYQTPKFLAIAADPAQFLELAITAKIQVCDQGLSPQAFFGNLETLETLCQLYSELLFTPHRLSIQNGFMLDEYSSTDLFHRNLDPNYNPYLALIEKHIVPQVLDYAPDVVFFSGRMSYFNTACSQLLRKAKPSIHTSLTRHSSEYYSLNKITSYLERNINVFKMFNSLILEDFENAENELLSHLEKSEDIDKIDGLITETKKKLPKMKGGPVSDNALSFELSQRAKQLPCLSLSPDNLFNVHLDPYIKCYWNKCAFCGINKKYRHSDASSKLLGMSHKLDQLTDQLPANSYLWLIDEAIQPERLDMLADYFISCDKKFVWQARCRIDQGLLENDLPEKLAKAGLKELRLGLESASLRVLELMRKFDVDFDFQLVYQILERYSEVGISIHFPMIIGFPGEDVSDRQLTYEFLSNLREKFPLASFNINIFNFDVSSPLFKIWEKYPISELSFPCSPSDFIGNIINWDDPSKTSYSTLEQERNTFMRKKLYPWMPQNALIAPIILYRLSETIRNTLVWKEKDVFYHLEEFCENKVVGLNSKLAFSQQGEGDWLVYNWGTHHYLNGNSSMVRLLRQWEKPKTIRQGVLDLCNDDTSFTYEDILIFVEKMYHHGHLIECDSNETKAVIAA